jgi:stage III sporulation protein AF
MLCALIRPFFKTYAGEGIGKLITGVFLLLTLLYPMANLSITSLSGLADEFQYDAQQAVATGEANSKQKITAIIKERTAAYILQKADALGLELTVDVGVSSDEIPVPHTVTIRGTAAPYARQQLQDMICRDLGISKENQLWT